MAKWRDSFDGLLGACKEPSMATEKHERTNGEGGGGAGRSLWKRWDGGLGSGSGSEKRGSGKRKKGIGIGEEGRREEEGGSADRRRASSGKIASSRRCLFFFGFVSHALT
ncbi:hypothetical protein MRB53_030157 [Persea americana]|uniref:Uncharacterized protein n=1 Tax=Persea americana TaxID=3435 RepID=A0ACC2KL17_PERAE|nr:hypothetical protein MRB53_030157 [Persea americana]